MSVTKDGRDLLFDFHAPNADFRPTKVSVKILETANYLQIANILIPKDFSGDTVSNDTTVCNWRSDGSAETEYRIFCRGSSDKASEIVIFDLERGIVEWSTSNEGGSKGSDYLLQSSIGLLHACPG